MNEWMDASLKMKSEEAGLSQKVRLNIYIFYQPLLPKYTLASLSAFGTRWHAFGTFGTRHLWAKKGVDIVIVRKV